MNPPPLPTKDRKLVLVGDSAFAEIAYEYFTYDSSYEVVAFAVEQAYLKRSQLFGLPVVPFETLSEHFPPATHDVYVAMVYTQLNRLRTRLAGAAKAGGYKLASFISPRAFIWHNVKIGEHCFIFENNVIQAFSTIGNNVVLWTGNQVGHHSHIADNVFVAGIAGIAGFCTIGENTFVGGNSSIPNNINVAKDCWIGHAVVLTKDTKEGELYRAAKSEVSPVSALRFFRVKD
jgi:sugar O-acyltransferase (sialic acid O-acetyltransferase NeuD family)